MAYIEPPRQKKDGTLTWRVRWRKGGRTSGKREGEPFHDLTAAQDFCDAVTRAGDEWPWGYVPGIGWDHQAYAALLEATVPTEPAPPPEVVTLGAFAKEWASTRTKAQEPTRAKYLDRIRLYIEPRFGSADIADEKAISEDAVKKWVIDLLKGTNGVPKIEPNTLRCVHTILKSVLKVAVRRKLRETNPCEDTELPSTSIGSEEDEMTFLTRQQFHVLAEHLHEDVRDMATIAVNTGLRWGEISALQVRDVQGLLSPKPYIRVRRAWQRMPDNSYVLGPPKSKRSRRNVSINKAIALILVRLIADKKPTDYLFLAPRGQAWRHQNFFVTRWRPAVYRAIRCEGHRAEDGLKRVNGGGVRNEHLVPCGCPGTLEVVPRFHDLRHTHAAWVIADGGHLTTLQRRLGHSSIQITSDRYGHLPPEVDDALVAGLEAGWLRTLPAEEQKKALAA